MIDGSRYDDVRNSIIGILFLGTPHRGSNATSLPQIVAGIANVTLTGTSRFTGKTRSDLIAVLEKESGVLTTLSTEFRNQAGKLKIASFVEQNTTPPTNSRVRPPDHLPTLF